MSHYQEEREVDIEFVPKHYDKAIQPWEYMESVMSEEAFKGYLHGNIIKYVSRWEDKGGLVDLEKARHYLDKLTKFLS